MLQRSHKLVIVFLLLLAGSLAPSLLFTHKKPEVVVSEALAKLGEDRTFWASATVGMIAPQSVMEAAGADPNAIVPIVFVGQGGMKLPKDQPFSGRGLFTLSSADPEPLTLEVVATQDGTSYAKLANLPPDDGPNAQVIKALDGQWFSMPSRTLAGMISRNADTNPDTSDTPGTRPAATWQKVREQLIDGDLYGVPESLGSAGLRSVFVRRYYVPLMPGKLTELMQDVRSLQKGRALTAQELTEIAAKVAASRADLEVWVDVRTKELQQISLTVADIDPANPDNPLFDKQHFTLVVKIAAWDEEVDVTVPEASRPYSDILMPARGAKPSAQ